MKTKLGTPCRLLSVLLSLLLAIGLIPLSAAAADSGAVTVGDFTIAPADGSSVLTEGTDYTYSSGKLTITTAVPVTVGMKAGVDKTAEVIVTDSTNGAADITFKSISIETTEDEAITVAGSNKTTLRFSGTNSIISADTGIDVTNKTPLNITSADKGILNISGVKYGIACISFSASEKLEITGDICINISDCTAHAIYYRKGAVSVSGTPAISIDTAEYAIYGYGIDISGGTFTLKNDDGYIVCSGNGNPLTLSGQTEMRITEGERGLYTSGGKITVTDNVKFKVYGGDETQKTAAITDNALCSAELLIDKNASVDLFTKEDAISGGVTKITDNAQIDIRIDCDSTYSQSAIGFNTTLDISGDSKINIDIEGAKVYGLYDISDGTVNIYGNATVNIEGAYRSVYADQLNLSGSGSLTAKDDLNYAVYGVITIRDSAVLSATSSNKAVLYEEFTVQPAEGKAYMVKAGANEAEAETDYYVTETTLSEKSSWRYFRAEPVEEFPVTLSFDTNGGEAIDPITVTYNQKYGRLPSSAVTGLAGGDSNWYLVDEDGNLTDIRITRAKTVEIPHDHELFVVRKVLNPTLKLTLTVPGAISDGYQNFIPSDSRRILTVTVNNQNAEILDYTYEWYKDGELIEGENEAVITLEGNVSDTGTYKVKVTATLKDGTGIVVTSDTASAEKEQKVKILRAANSLYYDANSGEGGPSNNFSGGDTITVQSEEPTREGYIFSGWNTKADGTGVAYEGGDTHTFAEDNGNGGCILTLYAQWTPIPTDDGKDDGGSGEDDTAGEDSNPSDIPDTGDYTDIGLWFALVIASCAVLAVIGAYGRKRINGR